MRPQNRLRARLGNSRSAFFDLAAWSRFQSWGLNRFRVAQNLRPGPRPNSSKRRSGRCLSKSVIAATVAQLQKGGLRLDSRESLLKGGESGPVVSPGHPEKSELVRAINYEADGFQMPPTGKLDADSIGALTEWIREGAPWPDHSTGAGATQSGARMDFAERAQALVVSTSAPNDCAVDGRAELAAQPGRCVPGSSPSSSRLSACGGG